MAPPRYSRDNQPWWLRLQQFQLWLSEKQYLFAYKVRKRWLRLFFSRDHLARDPSSGPRILTHPVVVIAIVIVIGFLLIFGEGLLNRFQMVEMMTGVDLDKSTVENSSPR